MNTKERHSRLLEALKNVEEGYGSLSGEFSESGIISIIEKCLIQYPMIRSYNCGLLENPSLYVTNDRFSGSLTSNVVDASLIQERLKKGATLAFQNLELFSSRISQMIVQMERGLDLEISTTLFLTPPKAGGLATHWDAQDVILLQLHGEKEWKLGPEGQIGAEPTKSVTLRAGEVLFIPRRTMHGAFSGAEGSIHISFVVARENIPRLLSSFASQYKKEVISNSARRAVFATRSNAALPPSIYETNSSIFDEARFLIADRSSNQWKWYLIKQRHANQMSVFRGGLRAALSAARLTVNSEVKVEKGLFTVKDEDEIHLLYEYRYVVSLHRKYKSALEDLISAHSVKPKELSGILAVDAKLALCRLLVSEGLAIII